MFKPEKNLKAELRSTFGSFFQDFFQSLANFCLWCATRLRKLLSTFCNVIIGYGGGMNRSMLDLYKKLESQERGEKREKWTQTEFLVFPFSIFFLFLSSLSFMSIFFFTYTREAAAIVFLCMFAFRKQETFLLYLLLYKKLYYSNFRILLSRPNCMQWSTLLSASLRRLFRNLWRIVITI